MILLVASGQPLGNLGFLKTRTAEEALGKDLKEQPRVEVKELVRPSRQHVR